MQSGGEATGYGEDGLATGVVGEDTGTGKREGHRCNPHDGEGQHEGQVEPTVVPASYQVGRLAAFTGWGGV
jgi:hypothetical protein